jgi:exportin-2 (importin alpha re-exporter)
LEVTQLFTGYIQSLLQEYGRDPMRAWRAKDTAIYLVLALTVQGGCALLRYSTTSSSTPDLSCHV